MSQYERASGQGKGDRGDEPNAPPERTQMGPKLGSGGHRAIVAASPFGPEEPR